MPNREDETHTCHIIHSSCAPGGLLAWSQDPTSPLSSEAHLPFPPSSALPHPLHCITRTLPGISFFKSLAPQTSLWAPDYSSQPCPGPTLTPPTSSFTFSATFSPLKPYSVAHSPVLATNKSGGPWSGHKTPLYQALQTLPAKDHVCSQLRNSLLWGAQF